MSLGGATLDDRDLEGHSARAFRSPYAAQFWYEWHAKGRVVFLSVLAILVGLWVWLSVRTPQPGQTSTPP